MYLCHLWQVIIPRGFGGIRTTDTRTNLKIYRIIPRGFGGIRTTRKIVKVT